MFGLFLPLCFCRNKSLPVWLTFAECGRGGFFFYFLFFLSLFSPKVWFRSNKTAFGKCFILLTFFVVRAAVPAHLPVNLRRMSVLAPSQLASPVQGSWKEHVIKRGRGVRKKNYKTLRYFVSGWQDFKRHKLCVLLENKARGLAFGVFCD